MIVFPRFGRSAGNLGNQMLQLMSMVGLSKMYSTGFTVPDWKYCEYFHTPPLQYYIKPSTNRSIEEKYFHYDPMQFGDLSEGNVEIFGWLQSKKYWQLYQDDVRKAVKFRPKFDDLVYNKMPPEIWRKPIIAISIRRGDYVGNPNYDLLPARYYVQALLKYFPDFKENYHVLLFSDDFAYCHIHFDCIQPYFAEGLSDIEQLCLMSMCCNFILANSTFSIVGAMLSELHTDCQNRKIIRPAHTFAGELAKKCSDRDLYPDNWICYDHKPERIDLTDVTFTIPVCRDSMSREVNVKMCIDTLQRDFDTKIIMGEQGPMPEFKHYQSRVNYQYYPELNDFHRTRMLNDMAMSADNPIVVNYDADVMIPPLQLVMAARMIRGGNADVVYPYDGRFARVDRKRWVEKYQTYLDAGIFAGEQFKGLEDDAITSLGGAVMCNREAFIRAGMENEHMINYGPEDVERMIRFKAMGLRIARIYGILFHMDHTISINSSNRVLNYKQNVAELEKIENMSRTQLENYVNSWPWVNGKHKDPDMYIALMSDGVMDYYSFPCHSREEIETFHGTGITKLFKLVEIK